MKTQFIKQNGVDSHLGFSDLFPMVLQTWLSTRFQRQRNSEYYYDMVNNPLTFSMLREIKEKCLNTKVIK